MQWLLVAEHGRGRGREWRAGVTGEDVQEATRALAALGSPGPKEAGEGQVTVNVVPGKWAPLESRVILVNKLQDVYTPAGTAHCTIPWPRNSNVPESRPRPLEGELGLKGKIGRASCRERVSSPV